MNREKYIANLIGGLLNLSDDHPDVQTTEAILAEAARFAQTMAASGATADRVGCKIEAGRVLVPPGQHACWRGFIEQGWNALSTPEAFGGQELPATIATAAQMLFDASDVALGMLALNQRCAIRMLSKIATAEIQALWIPRLASGEWGATICISEPQAGSDVGRIRTCAQPRADGLFAITGQKCWISYGDHDLTRGIVHFILARTPDMPAGTRGLSLFLLADQLEDGRRNGVSVLRIEEKLGMHASPTCVLAFDDALAVPLCAPGRGLASLFEMIVAMRLGVAAQGCAIATRAAAVATQYAFERGQGGAADEPPVLIHNHAEVRRMLTEMRLMAESMTALTLQAAAWIDAGDKGDKAAAARAAMLLPTVKALAAEAAFNNANLAIQVLGGAGYTKEWPVERLLRDSRVFSIYEGTTAVQALDLTFRQIFGPGRSAGEVLDLLKPAPGLRARLDGLIARLAVAHRTAQEQAALPLLRLFGLACVDGIMRRYAQAGPLAPQFLALLMAHEASWEMQADWLVAQSEAPATPGGVASLFAEFS